MADRSQLKYTEEHEWLDIEQSQDETGPDGPAARVATIGITEHAAGKLGDVVFVELPTAGTPVSSGKVIGEIESTKSVGELFSPVDGTVLEVNDTVTEQPDLVNTDPYGKGWLVRISFEKMPDGLLDYDGYRSLVGE